MSNGVFVLIRSTLGCERCEGHLALRRAVCSVSHWESADSKEREREEEGSVEGGVAERDKEVGEKSRRAATDSFVYQMSSVGRLDSGFTGQFLDSVGLPPRDRRGLDFKTHPRFRILFPSVETVTKSISGEFGASTQCLSQKSWEMSTFPRSWFCDPQSSLLLHSKVLLRSDAASGVSWVYVGSHNFSPSAWGRAQKTDEPLLAINNYEIGVVFPTKVRSADLSEFPLPFEFPLPEIREKPSGVKRINYSETTKPYAMM